MTPSRAHVWTRTVAPHLVGLLAALLAACGSDSTSPITVLSVSPADGAEGVPVDTAVSVTLSRALDQGSVDSASFTLAPATPGLVQLSGAVVTFVPSQPLQLATRYTATAKAKIRDPKGVALGSDFSWSFTTVTVPPDTTPPAAVTTLAVSVLSQTSLKVTWVAVGDDGLAGTASSYDLRWLSGSACPLTAASFSTGTAVTTSAPKDTGLPESVTVTGLTAATTYCFGLIVKDEKGNASGLSNIATASTGNPPDTTPPAAVADLAAAATGATTVHLTWTAPGNDGTTGTAAGYDLRRSTTCPITSATFAAATAVAGVPAPHAAGTHEAFDVTGLTSKTAYCFALETRDGASNVSAISNVAGASTPDVTPPSKVTDLAAAATSGSVVHLTWTAPGDDGATGTASLYDLRRATTACPIDSDAKFAAATAVSGTPAPKAAGGAEAFDVTGLADRTAHCFALVAKDAAGNAGPVSNSASATTPDATPPAAVTDLAATATSATAVHLTWTAPGNDGAAGTAAAYLLKVASGAACPLDTQAKFDSATAVAGVAAPKAGGSAEAFDVTGLADRTAYCFALETQDAVPNTSGLSNSAAASTPDGTPPAAVANLAASATSGTVVHLTWTAPGGDGSTGTAAAYDLRRAAGGGCPIDSDAKFTAATAVTGVPAPQSAGAAEVFDVTGLSEKTAYCFALKSQDAAANVSGLSNSAAATTPDRTAPAAVADLAATAPSDVKIHLTWTAPGDDGSTGTASSYDVAFLSGNACPITAGSFAGATHLAGVAAPKAAGGAEQLDVTGLTAATAYCFALKTTDGAGNVSGLSNVAAATTRAVADTTPPATVADLAAGSFTFTGATLTWTEVADDGATGASAAKADVYAQSGGACPITSIGGLTPITTRNGLVAPGATETVALTGLSQGTSYCFVVVVSDSAGNPSAISNNATGTTLANYSIGGTATGVGAGPLLLQDNGGDDLTVTADGAFSFATRLNASTAYAVTVKDSPPGADCAVSSGTGTVGSANVTSVSVACTALTAWAVKVGDGTTTLGTTTAPVKLEKFRLTDGTSLGTIDVTGVAGATLTGNAGTEGFLARAYDGKSVSFGGYAVAAGSATSGAQRVVIRVDGSGTPDASTKVNAFSGATIRGAVSLDGTAFWVSGSSGGVFSVPFGYSSTTGGATALYTPTSGVSTSNTRSVNIFANELFFSSGSTPNNGLTTLGSPPPASGATPTLLNGFPGTTSYDVYGFALLDTDSTAGVDTAYVAFNGTPLSGATLGVERWKLDTTVTPAKWNKDTAFLPSGLTTGSPPVAAAVGARGLAVRKVAGHLELIATTNESTGPRLVAMEVGSSNTPAVRVIGAAAANYALRGVSFAPELDTVPPAAVADLAGTAQSETSVKLTWTAPGNDGNSGTAASYDVRYSTACPLVEAGWAAATQASGEPTPKAAGGSEQLTLSGLAVGTAYCFALKSADASANVSAISNSAAASTPDSTPPTAVTTLAAGATSATAVHLTWKAPSDNGPSGRAASYQVRYLSGGSCPITSGTFSTGALVAGAPVPQAAGADEALDATGLASGTSYCFALESTDAASNTSAISNVATASTPDVTPPSAVADLAASATSESTIHLTWHAPGNDGAVGTAASYDVRWSTTCPITDGAAFAAATQVTGVPAPQASGALEQLDVGGLTRKTHYCFALKSADAATPQPNVSAISNTDAAATTPDQTPPAAVVLAGSQTPPYGVTITWNAPGDDGLSGLAFAYDLRLRAGACTTALAFDFANATPVGGLSSPLPPTSAESFEVTPLALGAWCFALETIDHASNTSAISNLLQVTVNDTLAPAKVTDLNLGAAPGVRSLRLGWTAPDANDGQAPVKAASYELRYSTLSCTAFAAAFSGGTLVTLAVPLAPGSGEAAQVGGLIPSTQYCFILRSKDAAGNDSPLSNALAAATADDPIAPAAVTTLHSTGADNTSVSLAWTEVGDDPNPGDPGYGLAADHAWIIADSTSCPTLPGQVATRTLQPLKLPGDTETVTVSGLAPGTDYCFVVFIYDTRSASLVSNAIHVSTTSEFHLGGSITGLNGSITLNTGVSGGGTDVTVTNQPAFTFPGTLTTGTHYAVAVKTQPPNQLCTVTAGTGDIATQDVTTVQVACSTLDVVPPVAIADLSARVTPVVTGPDAGKTAVALHWSAPSDQKNGGVTGAATSYTVLGTTDANCPITAGNQGAASVIPSPPTPGNPGDGQDFAFDFFGGAAVYCFAVLSSDGTNTSALSNLATPPGLPTLALGTSADDLSIKLSWTEPTDDGAPLGTLPGASKHELRWRAAVDCPITADNFDDGASTPFDVTNLDAPNQPGNGQTVSVTVTGLQRDAGYCFGLRLSDADSHPNRAVSASLSASTTDTVPPDAVTLAATTTSTSAIHLAWSAPGDDGAAGQASEYFLRYAPAPGGVCPIDAGSFDGYPRLTTAAPKAPPSAESADATGLTDDTNYCFGLITTDNHGNKSALSNLPQAKTDKIADVTPPAAVADLRRVHVNPTDVTLAWTAPGDDGNAPGTQATRYHLRYYENQTCPANPADFDFAHASEVVSVPAPQVQGSAESFKVTGLVDATHYCFALETEDEVPNLSPISNLVDVLTGDYPPDAVTLAAQPTGPRSIQVSWLAPDANDPVPGTAAASYDLRLSGTCPITAQSFAAATQVDVSAVVPAAPSTPQSVNVTELLPSSGYCFALTSRDAGNHESALSNSPTAITADDVTPPGKVVVSVTATTGTTATLEWDEAGDDGFTLQAAKADVYATTSCPITSVSGLTPATTLLPPGQPGFHEVVTLTGLSPHAAYCYAVRVTDHAAVPLSTLSDSVSGPTKDTLPPAAVSTLAASGLGAIGFTLGWTAPADDDGSKVTSYEVRSAPGTCPDQSTAEGFFANTATPIGTPPAVVNAGSPQAMPITGLTPLSTYCFALVSRDAATPPNQSPVSNLLGVTTLGLYNLGGSITGLVGSLTLQSGTGQDVTVSNATGFAFAAGIVGGTHYNVAVKTQPATVQCSVTANGSGDIAADVSDVQVTCVPKYVVGGTVSGLAASTTLVLQLNAANDLNVTGNGPFNFPIATAGLIDTTHYAVSVLTQPAGQTCALNNASGNITGADVTSVQVTCSSASYAVNVTATGVTSPGGFPLGPLVLQDNGADDLTIATDTTSPAPFATQLQDGAAYSVTLKATPTATACVISGGIGNVASANVSVTVTCTPLVAWVLRVGPPATPPLSSTSVPVSLDKYQLTDGTLLGTIGVPNPPDTTTPNKGLTLTGSSVEGFLSRSVNGKYVSFAGYGAPAGTATVATTGSNPRVIARVGADGVVDTSTRLDSTAYTASNIRSAVSGDGSAFWATGTSSGTGSPTGGTWYAPFGSTAKPTQVQLYSPAGSLPGNIRVGGIYLGELFFSSGSGTIGLWTLGSPPPVVAPSTPTVLSGFPGTPAETSPYGFAIFALGGVALDTAFVAVDATLIAGSLIGVDRFTKSGGTWSRDGTFKPTGLAAAVGGRALAARQTPNGVLVLATTSESLPRLVRFEVGASATPQITPLATSATNNAFRGVAFAPDP